MPYTDPAIQDAHDLMYGRFTNDDLQKIGKVIDGADITQLGKLGKLKLSSKTLFSPLRKDLKRLRTIMRGFRLSRDWGF